METIQTEKGTLIKNKNEFLPEAVFECGQCFRFEKTENGYNITANGRCVSIIDTENGILLSDVFEDEYKQKWSWYFDAERDYDSVAGLLCADENINRAYEYCRGLRILKQEPFETLISFIISQNNNIPRIKKIIASLCALFGERQKDGSYAFPTPQAIANAGIEGLAPVRAGFRAKYIFDAASKVCNGELVLGELSKMGYEKAKAALMTVKGVGPKVADCVLLFSCGYMQAFPVDVWIKKVITKYYGEGFTPERFGEYAGIAQQYLFYYERNHSESAV